MPFAHLLTLEQVRGFNVNLFFFFFVVLHRCRYAVDDDEFGYDGDGGHLGSKHGVDGRRLRELLRAPPPPAVSDLTAMLWRLELSGVAAGFR